MGGDGATLVIVAGLHGNEPAGVLGAMRVIRALREERSRRLQGRVVFLTGNRAALSVGVRFLDRDLNRAWTSERLRTLRMGARPGLPESTAREDREQRELLAELDRIIGAAGPTYALDLHTTSGPDGVFTTIGDTLENRDLAQFLPVPLVLGLEELVEGTLHEYLGERGVPSLAFESGQHEEPEAIDRAEAAIWLLLVGLRLLPESAVPEIGKARGQLVPIGEAFPKVLEFRHRHELREGDGFRMRPGFRSFQRLRAGTVVGDDLRGGVSMPEDGRILMPLYQSQGSDGFFVVREFKVFWLRLSRVLRGLGVGRFVHWLPGIREHPSIPGALDVNKRVARWYALQVLHLLGFRRQLDDGDRLVVLRRGKRAASEGVHTGDGHPPPNP